MKSLVVFVSFLAATSAASACGGEQARRPVGSVSVTWSTLTADAAGAAVPTGCPDGATTAVVRALPEGSTADPFEDRFACGDGAGTASDLPVGRYVVWVELTDETLTKRFAESTSQVIEVQEGAVASASDFGIFLDHAFFTVSWELRPPGSTSPQPCSSIPGATAVSISVSSAGGALYETVVGCEDGLAPAFVTTRPIPSEVGAGPDYTIAVSFLDAADAVIASATTILPADAGALDFGNDYEDLGVVVIDQGWQ